MLLVEHEAGSTVRAARSHALTLVLFLSREGRFNQRRLLVPGFLQTIPPDPPHHGFVDLIPELRHMMRFPLTGFERLGPVVEREILRQHQLRHVVAKAGTVVSLLEVRPDDGEVEDRLILLLLPRLVLVQQLPGHMGRNTLRAGGDGTIRIGTELVHLHQAIPVYNGGIGTRMELHRSNGDEGKSDVGATLPGEGLRLLQLQSQVHPGFIALEPMFATLLIEFEPLGAVNPDACKVRVGEMLAEVRRPHRSVVEDQFGLELKHQYPVTADRPSMGAWRREFQKPRSNSISSSVKKSSSSI